MHRLGRRRRGLLVTGVASVLLAASVGPTTAAEPQRADPLQREVDAVHGSGVVGVLAEVTSPGTRDRARAGTARIGTGRPMPWDGRFRIGSATKTFTAAVVLQLVGEGRLSLEDTVERRLPGVVRGNGNDGSRVTVRQLLQHTSHIPEVLPDIPALNSADGYRAERFRTYTPEEVVARAMRHPPVPGSGWSYSNTNYILAAMIIQKVTHRSWADEVEARIIRPLDLKDTAAPGTFPWIPGPHAQAYTAFGTGTGTGTDVTALDTTMAVGSGSLISSTHDLNRFYAALLDGRLLLPAQVDEMTTTVPTPDPGVDYGLGLGKLELPCGGSYFGHPGNLLGYRTWGGVTRDGARTAVVYVNSDGGQDTQRAMTTLVEHELCRTRPEGSLGGARTEPGPDRGEGRPLP
ncbi:serine hydrolase domain-containing protein [Streptomyces sp. NPDC057287]|uniref:serine hydrolase domain-containing protein n=1 Tax=Streptomyces sp. NPDC057287 TaxID=3346086 RepID=UPI0036359078